jgi:type VI secretion system secreted protein Hcp
MAGDMFLKLSDIKGESVDQANPSHQDEIDVIGWSFGLTNPASFALGQGGQQSKPTFSDLHITKYVDKATAALCNAAATGKHIKDGILTCRKAIGDNDKLEYLKWTLTDVLVTSVQHSGSGGEQYVHESVSLTCAVVELTYQVQADLGSGAGNFDFQYDLQKQTAKVS